MVSRIDLTKWLEWLDQTAKMFAEAYEPEETYTEDEVRQALVEAWSEGWNSGYYTAMGVEDTTENPYNWWCVKE